MLADRVRMVTFKDSLSIPEGYVMATDDDFSGTSNGAFKYIGTALKVVIPDTIKGLAVTNYSNMFNGSSVIGVVNYNNNVTSMFQMFYNSQATTLDLSSFDTSNITNTSYMYNMFRNAITTTGYARTQADADKFNGSSGKPTGLNFVVKP